MMNSHSTASLLTLLCATGILGAQFAFGGTTTTTTATSDDFTQANDSNAWKTFNGACLTAGDGTGTIPACKGLAYYKGQVQVGGNNGYLGTGTSGAAPTSDSQQSGDAAGYGALRFTNGNTAGKSGFQYGFNQAGSIISSGTPFPTGAGIQVLFKTVTYRGNSGNGDGADGMSFFLMDGGFPPYDTGAFGGSLGYSCSNSNYDSSVRADGSVRGYDGLIGAYIGVGIDEYGNFLNQGDNTNTGSGQIPGRIGVRGRGNTAWPVLKTMSMYSGIPDSLGSGYVQSACSSGKYKDGTAIQYNYGAFGPGVVLSSVLPGKQIANESAVTRSDATPIAYNLKISQDGYLSLYMSYGGGTYLPVITRQNITATNGTLPGSFRFGFAGSSGGSNNIHEILCFQASPNDLAGTGVGVNQQQATKIASGTQAFLAYYYPSNWTGRLTANDLVYDATSQTIGIASTANWDAQCNLTGVPTSQTCPTTGLAATAQDPTKRTMLTFDPIAKSGIPFEYTSLSPAMQATIDAGDTTAVDPSAPDAKRVNYLRGDRSNEISQATGVGLFRARDGVLSDIIDSSPTWVGPAVAKYGQTWKDLLNSTATMPENNGTQSYSQFTLAEQTRLNMVYTGANDGFLHGFRAGSFDTNGAYVSTGSTPNDGQELLAYMPGAVFNTIHNTVDPTQDFAGSQYSHNFYVDATPEAYDLFYKNTWHTWLVGGLGAGGNAVYALDVTDPTTFSENNPTGTVMGEWSSATITCHGNSTCGQSLGNAYGTPIVRRMHNGKWALIFGNGFGSIAGDAGIFILIIDPASGTISDTYYLSTGKTSGNGIAYVSSADLDGDRVADYLYAGDLLGNVWRFDVTGNSEGSWAVKPTPLFTTAPGQPITTRVSVVGVPQTSGNQILMVDFGTGRKFPQTNTSPTSYATGIQSLYGVWDWDMSTWNGQSSVVYATAAATGTLTPSNLTTQTLTQNADTSLSVTNAVVCWAGTTSCSSGNNKYGFVVNLPNAQEQLVFNPLIYQSAFIVNSTIPATNSVTSCKVSHDLGNTIAISLVSGGSLGSATAGSFFKNTTNTNAAGSETNGVGTPFLAQAGGNSFIFTQSLGDGTGSASGNNSPNQPFKCSSGNPSTCSGMVSPQALTTKRLTWIQRR